MTTLWANLFGYPRKYSSFMPDLLWSGWVWVAPPTLPLDASGTLSRLLATAARSLRLPCPSLRSFAGGSRQGAAR